MRFSSDPELESLVGRVCLVFARVEQEAGQVVASAHGNWDAAMSTDYLEYSSISDRLLNWLKNVGRAYPETEQDLRSLRTKLKALKSQRDEWAHSAAVVDLFLMMKEDGRTSMSDRDVRSDRLLNAKRLSHIEPPTTEAVDAYCAQASAAGDEARSLASTLAALADQGVRQVRDPRTR